MTNHPITPPPELRRQWLDNDHFPMVTGTHDLLSITRDRLNSVIDQAAQWGSDHELEACCLLLDDGEHAASYGCHDGTSLRAARRPKPPTLKEQALKMLRPLRNPVMTGTPEYRLYEPQAEIIRRALEALDD
jgi:hypothetical protein